MARRVPRRRRAGRRRDPAPDRGRRPRPGHPAAVRRTAHRRRPGDRPAAQHGGVGARPRGPGRREGPRADHLPAGCLPAGPALDERARDRLHRVPRHPALARRAAAPGGHGRRRTSRSCTAASPATSASSCGWRSRPTRPSTRSASCWPPTPPARASTCSATATGWSTTTSRSTRTGSSSGSAASTATARRPHPTSATSSAPAGATPSTPSRRTWSSSPGWRGRSSRCATTSAR